MCLFSTRRLRKCCLRRRNSFLPHALLFSVCVSRAFQNSPQRIEPERKKQIFWAEKERCFPEVMMASHRVGAPSFCGQENGGLLMDTDCGWPISLQVILSGRPNCAPSSSFPRIRLQKIASRASLQRKNTPYYFREGQTPPENSWSPSLVFHTLVHP